MPGRLLRQTAHALLKIGAVNGLSVGFITKNYTYDTESDVRTITKNLICGNAACDLPGGIGKARVTSVSAKRNSDAKRGDGIPTEMLD